MEANIHRLRALIEAERAYYRSREEIIPEQLCDDEALAQTEGLGEQLDELERLAARLDNWTTDLAELTG